MSMKEDKLPDTGAKRDETVKSSYDNQSSVLEGVPNDVIIVKDGSFSLTVKAATMVEEDDDVVSYIFSSFVAAFADIRLRVANQEDRRISSQLVDFLAETFFQMNILNGTIAALQKAKMEPLEL